MIEFMFKRVLFVRIYVIMPIIPRAISCIYNYYVKLTKIINFLANSFAFRTICTYAFELAVLSNSNSV